MAAGRIFSAYSILFCFSVLPASHIPACWSFSSPVPCIQYPVSFPCIMLPHLCSPCFQSHSCISPVHTSFPPLLYNVYSYCMLLVWFCFTYFHCCFAYGLLALNWFCVTSTCSGSKINQQGVRCKRQSSLSKLFFWVAISKVCLSGIDLLLLSLTRTETNRRLLPFTLENEGSLPCLTPDVYN